MDKAYNHSLNDPKTYKLWEKSGTFTPKPSGDKAPFSILMPPPNANDPLHIGHARFVAVEDALVRYHRMKGEATLWLPGSDHAGVETQYVFEKKLAKDGKSRFDFDDKTLFSMIWDYVQNNTSAMRKQLKSLGASCDWTRHKFTLDEKIVSEVYKTFKKLYDDGLVYRGERIVNYCPRCGTAYSQMEVVASEKQSDLYFLNYGTIKIATTRPETMFADVAVAVNPKDERYRKLIGKTARIPLVNREVPIIEDVLVDKKFGTGALKITPGHDALDFEIGKKHNLPIISVVDDKGRMINTPQKYVGMKAAAAKEKVVKDLASSGLITKTEKITHIVGTCYRDKGVIEPLVSKQWFVKVAPLAGAALKALNDKSVTFAAKKYEKMARHWLKNLKDWNISRQIVWGIRIPAFRCDKCLEWTITDRDPPDKCKSCQGAVFTQDTDTFDTWFSSGQWPYVTLRTTKPGDFEYFYPTSVMETAYDIIPFWVIRMIMLGIYETGKVPFKNVLIHGLVRDKEGQKISKSKGNVIDPIEMTEKYGADALRMAILWGSLIENDISLSEDNVRGQRNFANKVWNIARYILLRENGTPEDKKTGSKSKTGKKERNSESDKWIRKELKATTGKVTRLFEKYRLSEAAEEIYDFIWHKFADVYIEQTKDRKPQAQKTLNKVLKDSLKLLHPFMPFVTESIWQQMDDKKDSPILIASSWPKR